MIYAAFNIDCALGKFVAYVKLEKGQIKSDVRADAYTLVHKAFGKSARIATNYAKARRLPETAHEEIAGWGWIARA